MKYYGTKQIFLCIARNVVIYYSQLILYLIVTLHPESTRLILNISVFSYGKIVPERLLFVQFTFSPAI